MKKTIHAGLLALALQFVSAAEAIEAYKMTTGERIVLDGRFDETAWSRAAPFDEFWEFFPLEKVPARVKTEVRFAYDGQALYVAVRAWDPDPSQLRGPFARRDNVLSDQDVIVLNIDPVGTRKFAHFFRVNPRGVLADGLYNEDTSTEDFSPDFEFDAASGRFEGGWTAEFRIPFSVLRYAEPPSPTWSVLVWRNYPRDQRYRFASAPLPRDQTCFLCLNNPLTGLTDLPSTRHLALTPNVTLRTTRDEVSGSAASTDTEFVPSLDIKWRPRPDTIVDATLNPDFSQVELDTPQLSGNTQFALFYPEKRPFFLEGADILEGPMRALYTRSVTDPSWGTRVTQRSEKFDGTVLVSRDDGGGLVLLPGTYGTDYANQDFKSLASFARGRWQVDGVTLGAVATDRSTEGRGYNRVLGPDAVWFPSNEHRLRAQLLGSWTTAQSDGQGGIVEGALTTGHAAVLDWNYRGANWDQYLNFEDVGEDFRADNGFVTQSGYRRVYSETSRKVRDRGVFHEVVPYLNLEYKTDRQGNVQYQQNNYGIRLGLPRATWIYTEIRTNNIIGVRPDGGLRKRDQFYIGLESNPASWFSRLFTELAIGDRLDVANNRIGKGHFFSFQANVRPHQRAEVEYRIDDDVIDSRDPVEGSARIIRQRAQQLLAIWHFTARDSLRTIWQAGWVRRAPSLWETPVSSYEKSDTLSVVYGHRRGIGLTFYAGFTFGRYQDADAQYKRTQSEAFVKGSWTFDVL
jgi:hypothetical protein